jgi:hypothetical protein
MDHPTNQQERRTRQYPFVRKPVRLAQANQGQAEGHILAKVGLSPHSGVEDVVTAVA